MANVYAVRIHELADGSRDRLRVFTQGIDGSYIFAREVDATRAHYQGWVRCDVKPQALRARLKKTFPECVGNKGYSITQVKDFEAYSRYILKGTREEMAVIVAHCGIEVSDEFLASEHRAYWSTRADRPERSNRAIVDEVEEWARAQAWDHVDEHVYDVAQKVADVITGKKKGLSVFYARSVVNTVMYRQSDAFKRDIIHEIISKY